MMSVLSIARIAQVISRVRILCPILCPTFRFKKRFSLQFTPETTQKKRL